jgi:hypothetical protein
MLTDIYISCPKNVQNVKNMFRVIFNLQTIRFNLLIKQADFNDYIQVKYYITY